MENGQHELSHGGRGYQSSPKRGQQHRGFVEPFWSTVTPMVGWFNVVQLVEP